MVKGSSQFANNVLSFHPLDNMKIAPDEIFAPLTKKSIPTIREYYLISNYGRIYNKYTESFLVLQIGSDGYYAVALSTDNGARPFRVNRLVMLAFYPIPNADVMVVNHLDCNPLNNHISNLEWTTRSGNAVHAYDNGLMKYGEEGPTAKISKETALKIARLLQDTNMTYQQIIDAVGNGATIGIVQGIAQGTRWIRDIRDAGIVLKARRPKSERSYQFTKPMVHQMCQYFAANPIQQGESQIGYCEKLLEYFDYFGFDLTNINTKYMATTVRNIYARKIHTDVSSQYKY